MLVAPGGVGKSALALGQAVAVATGRPILGERVHHTVPAWVLNLEDPLDELHRRLAALMQLHGVPRAALEGRLFLHSGRAPPRDDGRARRRRHGSMRHPDRDAIVAAASARGDRADRGRSVREVPPRSTRTATRRSTPPRPPGRRWRKRTGAAVLLVHHVRKGVAGRCGGGARRQGADRRRPQRRAAGADDRRRGRAPGRRSPGERWRYIRLDDAKANLAPRAEAALWYRLDTVALHNATDAYPNGDHVAAIAPWTPPSTARAGLPGPSHPTSSRPAASRPSLPTPLPARPDDADSPPDAALCSLAEPDGLGRVLAVIDAGPGRGLAFAAHRGGARARAGDRWVGRVLIDRCGLDEAAAARAVAAWLRDGVLEEWPYRDPHQRKRRFGVRVARVVPPPTAGPDDCVPPPHLHHEGYSA